MLGKYTLITCSMAALLATGQFAWAAETQGADFLHISLEELANMEVTSVSKSSEKASEAAAAIYVITQEDIRRSGMRTIPELLRQVPGLHVAKAGSNQWAISSRGFNDQFANKLLVLMDGRTVYTPEFSGVWWDVQDTLLADIERIEVIRGPGATLWGSNAVNGVINIITKDASDTLGSYAEAGAGTFDEYFGAIRHGAQISDNGYMRVYAKHDKRDAFDFANSGTSADDAWEFSRAGFRADWAQNTKTDITLQGDLYSGNEDSWLFRPSPSAPYTSPVLDDQSIMGGNMLARINYEHSANSLFTLQSYIDYTHRDIAVVELNNTTFDIEAQHSWQPNAYHDIVWGVGYRLIDDNHNGTAYLTLTPESRPRNLYSAFVQDKIALIENEWYLTLGSKFEHNDFTGFEAQPSARMTFLVDDKQTVWAAVSRAIRTPSRSADDLRNVVSALPNTPFGQAGLAVRIGNRDVDKVSMYAYELGYRVQPDENLAIDVTGFYNRYDDLVAADLTTPFATNSATLGNYVEYPFVFNNSGEADAFGGELAVNWHPTSEWMLSGAYSYINVDLTTPSNTLPQSAEETTPEHMFNLRSQITLPHNVEFDQYLYYNGEIEPRPGTLIDGYWRFDMRVAWQPVKNVELSVIGQNLLDDGHREYSPFLYNRQTEVGRAVYGKVAWHF